MCSGCIVHTKRIALPKPDLLNLPGGSTSDPSNWWAKGCTYMQNFKCTTERFISVQHDQQLLAAFPMRIPSHYRVPSIPQALADSGWNSTGMNGLRENRHRLLCKPTCSLTHKPFNAPQHCRHIGSVDRYLPRSPVSYQRWIRNQPQGRCSEDAVTLNTQDRLHQSLSQVLGLVCFVFLKQRWPAVRPNHSDLLRIRNGPA